MTSHQPGSTSSGPGSVVAANPFAGPAAFAGPSQSSSPARVDPELCRVSVLSGRTQVDVALPADVPVASLIPELAGLLMRNQFGEPERVPDDLSLHWTLGKVGQKILDETRTLIESGIVDGDLLVLRSEATTELPTVYDDVIDAVAGITRREFQSWSPTSARWVGVLAFLGMIAVTGTLTLIATWSEHRYDLGALAFVAAVVFFVADLVARNNGGDRVVGAALSVATCFSVFVGCFAVLSAADHAANVLLGAGVSILVAVVALRVTAGEPFTHLALITVSTLVALGAVGQLLFTAPVQHTTAVLGVIALLVALIAPRLTILLVRLPVPTVPSAGASLDDIDPPNQQNVNPGVAAIGAVALPETAALELRAKAANAHMSGLMLGAAAVAAVCAVITAVPAPDVDWKAALLGALIALATVLRGRSHSDLVQAAGMIGLGAVALLGVIGAQFFAGGVWVVVAVGILLLLSAAAFYFGVITPNMEFSPVLRRIGEILEYLVIAATVPIAAWVIGLYSLARGI
ncbi:type VII secretion integral membrane protein EccD [Williamsia maris]|uniref:Type VII secretion integral membrane protein EccD n=1 Tax=Williamsia maris TaxID=72806 RepID=A0ABT1HE25_9NOCA|nr:type VII secretion integral membrane protein EccD [Williamsia maris]MCP2175126.1 type VII secretion integral membrane protein EccD [Williamsia maris]